MLSKSEVLTDFQEHVEKGERKHLPIVVKKCRVIVMSVLDQKTPQLIDLSNNPILSCRKERSGDS